MKSFDRQRRFPRYVCSYGIAVVDDAGHSAEAECRSLSEGGFGATLSSELTVGTIVSILFKPLLLEKTVCLKARVLYHEAQIYGFQFVAPGASQREAIATLFKEAVHL